MSWHAYLQGLDESVRDLGLVAIDDYAEALAEARSRVQVMPRGASVGLVREDSPLPTTESIHARSLLASGWARHAVALYLEITPAALDRLAPKRRYPPSGATAVTTTLRGKRHEPV